jgi:hypothetical protein
MILPKGMNAPRNQDFAIGKKSRGVSTEFRHIACSGEGSGGRVVDLRRLQSSAARDEDSTCIKHGRRVTATGSAHAAGCTESRGYRIIQFCAVLPESAVFEATARKQDLAVGKQGCRVRVAFTAHVTRRRESPLGRIVDLCVGQRPKRTESTWPDGYTTAEAIATSDQDSSILEQSGRVEFPRSRQVCRRGDRA